MLLPFPYPAMSISYEEALSTLESMFGEPWTRQTLDTVLRHYQGHMENTVDALLRHGDKEPQALIDHLQAGVNPEDASISMDEQFARQLAQEERGRGVGRTSQSTRPPAPAPAPAPAPKGRGTPTSLPEDFLRVPGVSVTSTSREAMDEDEALARMLQDELFSQELANNPEFAHLARGGRPRMVGGLPSRIPSNRTNHIGEIPSGGSRRSTAGFPGNEGPNINIMETIAGESSL